MQFCLMGYWSLKMKAHAETLGQVWMCDIVYDGYLVVVDIVP